MQTIKMRTLAWIPVAGFILAGCHSTANYQKQAQNNPALAGGAIRVESEKVEGVIESIDAAQRTAAIKLEGGASQQYRLSTGIMNLAQLAAGTQVKGRAVEEQALFLNNAPLPSPGPGVSDFKTTIHELDKSYLLITLNYPNDQRRDFKVPIGTDLKNVNAGDQAVVRSTTPILVELRPND